MVFVVVLVVGGAAVLTNSGNRLVDFAAAIAGESAADARR